MFIYICNYTIVRQTPAIRKEINTDYQFKSATIIHTQQLSRNFTNYHSMLYYANNVLIY
jgi:hypothetical protein